MKKRVDEIPVWVSAGTGEENGDFAICGIRVWDYEWQPLRGETKGYRIESNRVVIEFKAEEVRPLLYSFWVRNKPGVTIDLIPKAR